ncbi:hypothetical protein H5410_003548 [Solanum commersonii]|uniref:Uncharacterized protein n=1 Tax=Solanum commersonii TaxID=4109 RepID=A0A9J6B5Y4_SOLCO|nr:hypothetical protein H5410_003548 [Solanum commersonii]
MIAKNIWRLTERFLVRPLSAPLYSLCTAFDESPKYLRASPTDSVKKDGYDVEKRNKKAEKNEEMNA